jgi:hypothetical protein
MTKRYLHILTLTVAATSLIALSGCATVESVEHAQSTANQALSTAGAAQQAAAQAQQTGSQALGAAQNAQQSADRANTAVGALKADLDEHKASPVHRGPRG